MFPDFKIIIYKGISKNGYDYQNFSYKPDLYRQFPNLRKNIQFLSFSCEHLILLRLIFILRHR